MMAGESEDLKHLRHAARLALRGHGGAEPNPQVGCVIVSGEPGGPAGTGESEGGQVVGWGYHRRCGGPHAEVVAIGRAKEKAKGATLYCTLEPCDHTGRTGPCTLAIINAGIRRVVIARRDPNPVAAGGLDRLRAAGIEVEVNDGCPEAIAVSDAFAQRVRSGLPWVTVKWAQTIDGRIATREGMSQWISGEASRRMVHRERGRVDAILTGIGTVLKDDPLLTARGVRRRRVAKRVVIDPRLEIPTDSKLVATADQAPVIVACDEALAGESSSRAEELASRGVELIGLPVSGGELPLGSLLRELAARHDVTGIVAEAGGGVMERLFEQRLVNEAWVFIGPLVLGDRSAPGMMGDRSPRGLDEALKWRLESVRRRGEDVVLRYRVPR